MNTKLLLTTSALVLGALGILGTFMPHEVLTWTGIARTGAAPLLVQLLAALLFAFAMINWTARGSLLGGIYNRPIAIGNMTHFLIGALALVKETAAGERNVAGIVLTVVYSVFAVAFIAAFFRSPVNVSSGAART